jgi:hypothetical protein
MPDSLTTSTSASGGVAVTLTGQVEWLTMLAQLVEAANTAGIKRHENLFMPRFSSSLERFPVEQVARGTGNFARASTRS